MNNASSTSRLDDDGAARPRSAGSLGKYRMIARLGTGGMAEVFLAVAQGAMNVNRLVVVKRLRDEQADDEASCTMFLNEARLAARLAHPNVIQTFEAGVEDGSYYLAMEYVDGQPLSRVLNALKRDQKRLDPRIAARICADALQGLHYAHELTDFDGTALEIVHRDVSPQNIMLTYDGVVKIVDFGIAKAAGTAATEHGVFKGKVAFMAPEQLLGGAVDRRVDVFAAGIVLWEAVTGKHLLADETPAKTLYNLMNKTIPRASELRLDVPAALDDIIARALERDIERRFPSAREMRDALESFIASTGGIKTESIGSLVTGLFAETRAKVQKEVKSQLAVLSLGRQSDPAIPISPHLSGTHIRSEGTLVDLSDHAVLRTASTSAGSFRIVTTQTALRPSRTRRIAMVVWIAVTLGAVGVSGLALSRSQRVAAPSVPATAASPAAVVTTTPAAPVVTAEVSPPVAAAAIVAAAGAERAPSPPVTHAPAPVAVAPPPQIWRPVATPRPASAPNTPAASADAPRLQPAAAAPAPTKPADDAATGRTFRRDL